MRDKVLYLTPCLDPNLKNIHSGPEQKVNVGSAAQPVSMREKIRLHYNNLHARG